MRQLTSRFMRGAGPASTATLPEATPPSGPPSTSIIASTSPDASATGPETSTPPSDPIPEALVASEAPAAVSGGISSGASRLVEGLRIKRGPVIDVAMAQRRLGRWAAASKPAAFPAAAAATVLLALGIGYGIGLSSRPAPDAALAHSWMAASADIKAVRDGVDALRTTRDAARSDTAGKQAQVVDTIDRFAKEQAGRLAGLTDQVDRMDKTLREGGRFKPVSDALERIEKALAGTTSFGPLPPPKPMASATVPAAAPAAASPLDVTQTGSIPEVKAGPRPESDPRKVQAEGYVLRDIDGGYALLETRAGRFVEVTVGQTVPGLGRVEAIERRGRQWVVVTPKGFIAER